MADAPTQVSGTARKGLLGCFGGSAVLVLVLVAAVVGLLFFAPFGCIGAYRYAAGAPPIEHTVALVESSPEVAAAIGAPVSVSLAMSRRLQRDWLSAQRGMDYVILDTKVSGSRGEAHLSVHASNHDGQGWAGSYELEVPGRLVLREGGYRNEGAATLLRGSFTRDGRPVPGSR